jgi:hypothetical protein
LPWIYRSRIYRSIISLLVPSIDNINTKVHLGVYDKQTLPFSRFSSFNQYEYHMSCAIPCNFEVVINCYAKGAQVKQFFYLCVWRR